MTRILSIILLFFTGVSALLGGGALIYDPSGGVLKLPIEMLQYSPFKDYLIPGIILFVVLGIGSTVAGVVAIRKLKNYPLWIIETGIALTTWIAVQIVMIKDAQCLHFIYGGIGIVLIVLGVKNARKTAKS